MASTETRLLVTRILFLVVSLLLGVLMLAGVEGLLRLAGIGSPPELHVSRLDYQQVQLPILVPDERPDGTPILRTRDRRLPYQSILQEKPKDALRIFAFGGSATFGLGFSPNVSFPHYLERMIRATPSEPGAGPELELVNLGIVALSSSQVREVLSDVCERYEPDLLLVYSGNNEFLELHAQKYADRHADFSERARTALSQTNLYRLASRARRGPTESPDLDNRDLPASNVRMTQDEIIRDIEVTPEELSQVVDRYEQNLEVMARTAETHQVPLVLMNVASNWEWRGREDLPEDYLQEWVGVEGLELGELQARALRTLSQRLQDEAAPGRWDMLFQRATLLRSMGRFDEARADYRASMNSDPHLRRALDAMALRVENVAKRRDAQFLDSIAVLGSRAEHGIIGFDQFYDYVHFTPEGALVLAAALYLELQRAGHLPSDDGFRPQRYVQDELSRIEKMSQDDYDVDTWLGIGFDRENLSDRNLWKYDEMAADLDALIDREPDNSSALVYRGNVHYHEIEGAGAAADDYRAALAKEPANAAIRVNLESLLRERSADKSAR